MTIVKKLVKRLFLPFRLAGHWYAALYKGRPWWCKSIAGLASCFVLFVLFLVSVDNNFLWLYGKSPSLKSLTNPIVNEASILYSADGVVLGKYFNENRSPVTYEEISPILITTLVNTEDERFYSHHGIDFQGLFAAAKDMAQGRGRGASTITQQLVKNMFRVRTEYSTGLCGKVPGLRLFIMKMKEWISAVKIETVFSKKEILTMYLNTVDFGSNAFGIKTAAKTYFNTTPDKLNYEQSATLVGLLKATTTYNPRINPKNSMQRRNVVLGNMLSHKAITKAQYDSLTQIPIDLDYSVENNYDGQALYFRGAVARYLNEWSKESGYNIYSDGLKIYTTLDSRMQQMAEEAAMEQMKGLQDRFNEHWGTQEPWRDEMGRVLPDFIENIAKNTPHYKRLDKQFNHDEDSINKYLNIPHTVKLFSYNGPIEKELSTMDSIRYMERFMHCSFVVMEPQTSDVKAWVGDLDFDAWKYDKVLGKRQPGSTFKLFVYATAMNQGMTPYTRYTDSYWTAEMEGPDGKKTRWTPHNADGVCSNESMTLRHAFAMSVNTIAAHLGYDVGIRNIIETARAMGIHSPMEEVPALSLGSGEVSLLELVNGYCTAVNDGKHIEPVLVSKILDRDGKVIYEADRRGTQAIPYRTAFFMQQLLQAGVYGGTSGTLWRFIHDYDTNYGGKTGTSSNHSDAWFVGCARNLVGGAWVGGEYRSIHFRTGELGQGNRTALPIFGAFMEKLMKDPEFKERYQGKFPEKPLKEIGDFYQYTPDVLITEPDSLVEDSLAEPVIEVIPEIEEIVEEPKVSESKEN